MDPVEMGLRIRALRERNRVSLRALAGTTGISPSLLSQIENGKTQPSVGTLYALVQQLDTSFDDLLGDGWGLGTSRRRTPSRSCSARPTTR